MNDEFIPIRTAVQISGMHPNTLRKYADKNQIRSYKSLAGQRMFHKLSLQEFCNPTPSFKEVSHSCKKHYLYNRVSSKKQYDDLLRQTSFLQSRDTKYANYIVIQDIASGINFKRKGLQTILDSCLQGTIGEVVVAHRDRLARFGFELLRYIIETAGGKITVIDDQRNKSSEQELSEDLLSIIHVYSCKQMGKRSYRSKNESSENTIENKQV
jgi:predicted site-specific integrase-resolvase